jgi:hypothetical protein
VIPFHYKFFYKPHQEEPLQGYLNYKFFVCGDVFHKMNAWREQLSLLSSPGVHFMESVVATEKLDYDIPVKAPLVNIKSRIYSER